MVAPPVAAASHEIQITDSAFGTPVLTVQVGDTVTWNNVDDRPHTATADDGAFDSGNLDEGASFSFTFTEPGTYTYLCEYHPDMQATVVVEPTSTTATPTASPAAAAAPGGTGAGAHEGDHASGAGAQPDTALPVPATVPIASFLLVGLGLVGLAAGLLPGWAPARGPRQRPRCGWRR